MNSKYISGLQFCMHKGKALFTGLLACWFWYMEDAVPPYHVTLVTGAYSIWWDWRYSNLGPAEPGGDIYLTKHSVGKQAFTHTQTASASGKEASRSGTVGRSLWEGCPTCLNGWATPAVSLPVTQQQQIFHQRVLAISFRSWGTILLRVKGFRCHLMAEPPKPP